MHIDTALLDLLVLYPDELIELRRQYNEFQHAKNFTQESRKVVSTTKDAIVLHCSTFYE